VLLLLWVVSDRPPFIAGDAAKWRVSFRGKSAIAVLVACAALASTGPYYALFTLVLLVLGVGVMLLARRDWRMVVSGGIVVVATLLVFALNLMPSLVYWAENGRNDVVGKRGVSETEVNGMKVSQLLLPVDEHRIGPLADLQEKSVEFTVVPSERGQQLGVIGALGFVGLLAFTLAALVRRRAESVTESPTESVTESPTESVTESPRGPPETTRFGTTPEILVRSGVYTVLAIVCGTVSGFSLLFSGVGLSQIRSWNRLSIFIGFFALLAVAFALDWLLPRLPRWHGRAVLAGVVCVALLAVGVFDQTTSADVPEYDRIERAWKSDEQFLGSIERELGPGAAVFQLPYVYFPEAGFFCGTGPYDQVRGYVHADQLQWSWGGMRGRETEWQEQVVRLEPRETLDALAAVGFSGVLIDRAGYPDRAQLLEDGYAEVLDERPQVSRNRRLSFFDLRPYARELRAELGPAGTAALRERSLAARPDGVRDRSCPTNVTGREPPPG
jgi:phosphoglycerol transferase